MRASRLAALGLLLALGLVPETARARPGSSEAEPTPRAIPSQEDTDLETLLDEIATESRDLAVRFDTLARREGEETTDLLRELARVGRQQREQIETALREIADRKKLGADVRLLVERSRQLLRRTSRMRRSVIRQVERQTELDAERRNALDARALLLFEHEASDRSALLDRTYQGLAALTEAMEISGMDVQAERAFLERHLGLRAASLLAVARETREQLGSSELQGAAGAADEELQARAFALEERADSSATSLLATLQMLQRLEVDTAELVEEAKEVTAAVAPPPVTVEAEAAGIRARHWLTRTLDLVRTRGPLLLTRVLFALLVLAAFWALARIARGITARIVDRTRIASSTILRDMIVRTIGRVVLLAGFVVALWQLGFGTGPVLAGVGIAGVAIGFALQDTLANFAAGGMILAYRPYDVGDVVEAAGITGTVQEMNVVSTRILTFDHQTLIVPNGKIWGDVIRNVTAEPTRRVDMEFGIGYEDDVEKAERLLREIVSGHDKVLADPPPVIRLHRLGESSVDFVVRPWARTEDYWDVYWGLTREVKLRFDREGISIPYPQRDVHLVEPGGGSARETEPPEEGRA